MKRYRLRTELRWMNGPGLEAGRTGTAERATNLPHKDVFWFRPDAMSELEESWHRNYGFGVKAEDLEALDDQS